jgi:hypothetical protein
MMMMMMTTMTATHQMTKKATRERPSELLLSAKIDEHITRTHLALWWGQLCGIHGIL